MKEITEFLKGVLEGCVLEIIGQGETYGYEITQKLRELGFEDVDRKSTRLNSSH